MSRYSFRLYVAGDAPSSSRALANLRALCREHLPDDHEIEVVDVTREPIRALSDGVLVTPMLVKLEPDPQVRVIGNLDEVSRLLAALDLDDPWKDLRRQKAGSDGS